jgi:hypothetical protein
MSSRLRSFLLLTAVLTLGVLAWPTTAQVTVRLFGTLSGSDATPQKVIATSDGYLGVSIAGGSTPSSDFTVLAGTSTSGTYHPGGIICQMTTSITDAATVNQWNVGTCAPSIPANVLGRSGDSLVIDVGFQVATNGSTKEYELYFAPDTATCSGTGADACNAGCKLVENSTASSAIAGNPKYVVTRTSTGNQKYYGFLPITTSVQRTDSSACTITETAASKVVFAVRNTSGSAASVTNSMINVWYYPAP